jgi:hypothetical protein
MRPDDAEALVSVMQAEWLGGEWLDDSGELTTRGRMFALTLTDYPPEDGAEAIKRLRERIPYRQGPQTADLKAALREVAMERDLARPALTDGAFTPPDEVVEILEGYFETVGVERKYEAMQKRVPDGDVEAKVELGRAMARAKIASEAKPSEGIPIVAVKERRVNPVTSCGVKWGERAIQDEAGVWCCPNCMSPIAEGCS